MFRLMLLEKNNCEANLKLSRQFNIIEYNLLSDSGEEILFFMIPADIP